MSREPRGTGERVLRLEERARAARAVFIARLPGGTGPLSVSWRHLRRDPALSAARGAWRFADHEAVTARDDATTVAGEGPPAGQDPE